MILKTDFFALLCVSIVCGYLLWITSREKTPLYSVIKLIAASIGILWIVMAMLYSLQ